MVMLVKCCSTKRDSSNANPAGVNFESGEEMSYWRRVRVRVQFSPLCLAGNMLSKTRDDSGPIQY